MTRRIPIIMGLSLVMSFLMLLGLLSHQRHRTITNLALALENAVLEGTASQGAAELPFKTPEEIQKWRREYLGHPVHWNRGDLEIAIAVPEFYLQSDRTLEDASEWLIDAWQPLLSLLEGTHDRSINIRPVKMGDPIPRGTNVAYLVFSGRDDSWPAVLSTVESFEEIAKGAVSGDFTLDNVNASCSWTFMNRGTDQDLNFGLGPKTLIRQGVFLNLNVYGIPATPNRYCPLQSLMQAATYLRTLETHQDSLLMAQFRSTSLTDFDEAILHILHDSRLAPGMTRLELILRLDEVARDAAKTQVGSHLTYTWSLITGSGKAWARPRRSLRCTLLNKDQQYNSIWSVYEGGKCLFR